MTNVTKGPGDLPGDDRHSGSPNYDDRFDELVEEILAQYRDDPAKVAEADDWWEGTLDGDTYREMERALADFHTMTNELAEWESIEDRLNNLARICHDARETRLRELAENAATVQMERDDRDSHNMRFGVDE